MEISKLFDDVTRARIRQPQPKNNWASNAGWARECIRYAVLIRLQPLDLPAPSLQQQRIYDEGEAQEKALEARLQDAGITIEARKATKFWAMPKIEAELDFIISHDGERALLEYKATGELGFNHIRKLKKLTDLIRSPHYWVRHYADQIQLYLKMFNEPRGILLFKNRNRNTFHQIDATLDDGWTDNLIEIFDNVNIYVANGRLPERTEKPLCQYCGFYKKACGDLDHGKIDLGQGTIKL